MALIVYPVDGWNTFVNIADATALIHSVSDGAKWDALTVGEQERMLITSAMVLSSVSDVSTLCDFTQAQIMLIIFDLENNGIYLTFVTAASGEYKKAKVGPLDVEFNLDNGGAGIGSGASGLPSIVQSLLKDCISGGTGTQGFTIV